MTDTPDQTSKSTRESIDLSKIDLPSDRLTLGRLRKIAGHNQPDLEVLSHNVVTAETAVVYDAASFVKAAGGTDAERVCRVFLEEDAKDLAKAYVEVGLASGRREAALIVDAFIKSLTHEKPFGKTRSGRE